MLRKPNVSLVALCLTILVTLASLAAQAQTPRQGTWIKKNASISGNWSIQEEGGARFLILSDDFKTKNAPDLKLFLSSLDLSAIDGKNATSHAVLIGKLKSTRGGQRYPIPADVDLDKHSTLLLHCEKYSKVWGGATIR
jgi:hypothetical protein